jgi:hypothetical protein
MNRKFVIIDEISIEFDENVLHWNVTQKELFDIRAGRNLVTFNVVLTRVLDLVYDCDITDEEYVIIRDALWSFLFQVQR